MEAPPKINPTAEQKLLTIYLDTAAYAKGKMLVASFADKHGFVEQHLVAELADGWTVVSINGFGGTAEGLSARGWLAVLLERRGA